MKRTILFIFTLFFCYVFAVSTSLSASKRNIVTEGEQMQWESIRDEAFSISGNYDSGLDSIGVSVTSDVTPRTIDISGNLKTGYMVKLFSIYTDHDLKVRIYADGINAFHDLGYIETMVRGGKTATWEFNQIDTIEFYKPTAGSSNPTVDFYLRTIRTKNTLVP